MSDVDEVVRRFETQEETANHLQELQARAEKEIRDLGVVKEKLEAEWELVKFMGQEENTELRYVNIKILVVTTGVIHSIFQGNSNKLIWS